MFFRAFRSRQSVVLRPSEFRSRFTRSIQRFLWHLDCNSVGLKHGLMILAYGHFHMGEHGQPIVAATALVACTDQLDLSF